MAIYIHSGMKILSRNNNSQVCNPSDGIIDSKHALGWKSNKSCLDIRLSRQIYEKCSRIEWLKWLSRLVFEGGY